MSNTVTTHSARRDGISCSAGELVYLMVNGELTLVETKDFITFVTVPFKPLDTCKPTNSPSLNYTKFHKHYGRNKHG